MTTEIKNLEELLSGSLEDGEKVSSYEVKNLTAPGENYGSTMLSVNVKTKNEKTKKERTLYTVVKLVPEDPIVQEMFNTPVSFKVEVKFYTTVVPVLDKYLKEKGLTDGVDFVAKSFGSRLSLNPNKDEVDKDAVLMLENLKIKGYTTGVKLEGLDLASAKMILQALAKFHGSILALKLENPEIFEKYMKPYTWHYEEDDKYTKMVVAELTKVLVEKKIEENVRNLAINGIKRRVKHVDKEPWSTLVHMDAWVNNLMLKYENNKPTNCILVDFQILDYKSPAHDVIFFIFSSLQDAVLEENVDFLLDFYYDHFIQILKQLGVDISKFSRSSFDLELKNAANECQYFHTITMLPPLLEKSFLDLNFSDNYDPNQNVESIWNEKHKRRIIFVLKEFLKRGWLQDKF